MGTPNQQPQGEPMNTDKLKEIRDKYLLNFQGSGGNKSSERFPYREINVIGIQKMTFAESIDRAIEVINSNSSQIPMDILNDILTELNQLKQTK